MSAVEHFELSGKNFTGQDLRGVTYIGCDLTATNFSGCDLTGASLIRCNLTRANLTDANLSECNLTGANLTGVITYRTNFTGAHFDNTNLDCDVNGCIIDLTGVTVYKYDDLHGEHESELYLRKRQIIKNTNQGYWIKTSEDVPTYYALTHLHSSCKWQSKTHSPARKWHFTKEAALESLIYRKTCQIGYAEQTLENAQWARYQAKLILEKGVARYEWAENVLAQVRINKSATLLDNWIVQPGKILRDHPDWKTAPAVVTFGGIPKYVIVEKDYPIGCIDTATDLLHFVDTKYNAASLSL